MQKRQLEEKDLVTVSALCIDAFSVAVAPSLSHEGVETFKGIASEDSFLDRMSKDNTILVYEENGSVIGVVELKEGRLVAMLFVSPDCQKKGVGRELFTAILPFVRAETVTVSASLNSVPAYMKYGFTCAGYPDVKSGLAFQPMELRSKMAPEFDDENVQLRIKHPGDINPASAVICCQSALPVARSKKWI